MLDYIKAMGKHVGAATFDVLFISVISLSPLLFGRLVLVFGQHMSASYWDFLFNGQLAFYSMGSLAAILLVCFRRKIPEPMSVFVGLCSVLALFFLMVLVGIDPTLNAKSFSFVGSAALVLYLIVQLTRIVVDALRRVDAPDALAAGQKVDARTATGLAERKGTNGNG
jgi:hypothetical protein